MQEILFETKLIDSTNYRKLKWARYSLYYLLLIIGSVLVEPRGRFQRHMSLQERLDLDLGNVVGVLLIIGVITVAIYYYSIQFEKKGEVRFSNNSIQIINQFDNLLLTFDEIEDLKIVRGATYHYEYRDDNYLHEANNWVSFTCDKKRHEYEFIIDSLEKIKNLKP
ncbi:MAG: hypothetical protein R2795_14695 [Saprospiraceae bacterium]